MQSADFTWKWDAFYFSFALSSLTLGHVGNPASFRITFDKQARRCGLNAVMFGPSAFLNSRHLRRPETSITGHHTAVIIGKGPIKAATVVICLRLLAPPCPVPHTLVGYPSLHICLPNLLDTREDPQREVDCDTEL